MSDATQRSGVFLDDRPVSRGPVLAPEAPAEPVALKDILGAHWRLGQQDMAGADRQAELDAYGPIETALMERGPKNWLGLSSREYTTFSRQNAWVNDQKLWADVAEERRRDPDFLKDVPAHNGAEFSAWVKANELKRRRTAQDVVGRQSGVVQHVAGFGADIATGLTDPINLGAMIVTGGAGAAPTIWRGMAREALINGGTEIAELPIIAGNRERFGEELTLGEAATSVAAAAAGGAMFHAAGAGVKVGAKAIADSSAGRAAARVVAPYTLSRAKLAGASDAEVARAFSEAVPAEHRTPEQVAALHVLGRDAEIAETSPFVRTPAADDAHNARLQSALAELLASGTARPRLASGTAIASGVVPTFAPSGAMPSFARPPDLSPDRVVRFVLHDLEGGAQVVNYSDADGGTTKYGIAARHNPGIDVANLSESEAAAIAKRKYWFPELDRADPRTAAIAFDAGYISGPKVGRRILTESGGDPAKALALYRAHLERIADTVAGKAKYRKGWRARTDKLETRVGLAPDDRVVLDSARLSDDPDDVAVSQRALDEADMDARMLDSERAAASRGQEEPIVSSKDADGSAMEASAFVEEPAAAAAEAAPVPEPQVQAYPQLVAPETRQAVRAYVDARRGSLDPAKVAKATGLDAGEVRRALESFVARPDGGILMARNGSFQRRPVRRAPADLYRFLAERGGIRDDEGHDLAGTYGLHRKLIPGVGPLIRKTGMSVDAARELAAEAGYFHMDQETAWHETTTSDILDLLDQGQRSPVYAMADLDDVATRDRDREYGEELTNLKGLIDNRLIAHGFEFDRSEMRRAAEAMRMYGLSEDEAILRVVDENLQGDLDASRIEAENDKYERLAEHIERDQSAAAGGGARGDGRSATDPGDAGERGAFGEERGSAAQDVRAERGLDGPPPLDGGVGRGFDDPDGAGAQASVDSLDHDLRAELDASDQYRIDIEGSERTLEDLLREVDEEQAAIDAARRCL